MNIMNDMGKLIAEKRKQAGLTQEAFADQLGITPQAVSKWENNIGLPDITLLPQIAKILNISINDLFSMGEPKKIFQFPAELDGLRFICSKSNKACYSSKEVELVDDDGNIAFKDGSSADLTNGYAVNKGAGEIRFLESDEPADGPQNVPQPINETLEEFNSISITISLACNAKILKSDNGIPKIEAQGNANFMKFLKYSVHDGKLTVEINPIGNNNNGGHSDNELNIFVNFEKGKDLDITINGASDVEIEPDFENSKININGCGDVSAQSTDTLKATVNGSGDINFDSVYESTQITVNGSGDISIDTANNVRALVNGSGDISIDTATGDLSVMIQGAGDMNIGGDVDQFNCQITGSGDIEATDLTVSEAEITLSGSADVTIGHILVESKEKIDKNSKLTVLNRG